MTLAVLFHRLGPYHIARLQALAANAAFSAVEFSKVDMTYAWDAVSTDGSYPVSTLFDDNGVETVSINILSTRMDGVLGSLNPRVIAIPGWSSPAALAALAWCCGAQTPAILMSDSTAHDEPRSWWKERVKSRVVRLFSSALVGGLPHLEYVAALGIERAVIFSGYDVVENAYFLAGAEKARTGGAAHRGRLGLPDRYFLASNRFIEKKNLSRLLDAYAAYVAGAGPAAWGLVLLGDGPLKPALVEQVTRLGLSDQVCFPGFKQYDELPVFYGLASAFIHASTSEQWGLVVNEAMASGLPVLVSERCGCAPDLVQNGVNGYTFDPYDTKLIADRMLQISSGNCDLMAMGQASREIIARWSPETFAAGMMKAATAALANPPPRAGWFDRALLWMLMRR